MKRYGYNKKQIMEADEKPVWIRAIYNDILSEPAWIVYFGYHEDENLHDYFHVVTARGNIRMFKTLDSVASFLNSCGLQKFEVNTDGFSEKFPF